MILPLVFLLLMVPGQSHQGPNAVLQDQDRDGLDDGFEEALLARFAPRFLLGAAECDGLPAEFRPDLRDPQLLAKNGTIYGQVFRPAPPARPGVFLEVHYYHLWTRDCGRNGHALDAEHVAALLHAASFSEQATDWKALYWYAAAHEDTICDAGHGARAAGLDAEQKGPTVWISGGKHASFLSANLCRGGCGGDDCSRTRPLTVAKLVNLGEPGAPLNGADWISSRRWPLAAKMGSDFAAAVVAALDRSPEGAIAAINESQTALKGVVLAGGSTAAGVSTAEQKGKSAAADKAAGGSGSAVKRAARAIWNTLFGTGGR